ncbi:hypothetical protein SAMN05216559_0664 [Halomicrobium zhouii]|uniref:Uncharacterized protein n=1 Tax=Halomicrobium zhouii TaxID=767519 RepID=A0A1I6KEH4_9EURY|nr:hypothetical protein [Halomicrobium zhouii]SFR89639.1 hypothetical protein SAMN05216559_0664 [Halomicrobium zhouii]
MRRSSVLLVSLLLLVGGAFAPLGAGADDAAQASPLIVSMDNTSNYLTVPANEVTTTGTTVDGLSLATAIDGDTTGMQSEFIRISFERSFESAANDTEKTAAIRNAADSVERRQQALERRDRAAVSAYANGSMTAAEFTRERARIHRAAAKLRTTIQHVDTVARADDNYSPSARMRVRLADIGGELEVLQGPASEHVSRAASGETPGQMIYAETSGEGYTLAYVTDDSYVRETYLGAERDENATDAFTEADVPRGNAARLRGYELYPWVTNHSLSPAIQGLGRTGIYRFTADFTDGELTAYIDGGTTNVFRESQRHKLSAMPVSNTITAHNDSLDMRVNKTYESGPLHVDLSHNETSVPANATVTVNGEPVGHTGSDGSLWLVEPRGPDRITATTEDNETVSVYLPD